MWGGEQSSALIVAMLAVLCMELGRSPSMLQSNPHSAAGRTLVQRLRECHLRGRLREPLSKHEKWVTLKPAIGVVQAGALIESPDLGSEQGRRA